MRTGKIRIYDMEGREFTSRVRIEGHLGKWKINISNLSNGVYILTLTNDLISKTQLKFIKQ